MHYAPEKVLKEKKDLRTVAFLKVIWPVLCSDGILFACFVGYNFCTIVWKGNQYAKCF